jgi:hypothetical protein
VRVRRLPHGNCISFRSPPSHTAQLTHTPYSSTRHQHRMLDKSPSFPAHMHLPESSAEGRTAQLWEVATVPRSDEHERRVRHVSGLLTASALRTWHQIQHLGGPRPDGNFSFGCPSKKAKGAILGHFLSLGHTPTEQAKMVQKRPKNGPWGTQVGSSTRSIRRFRILHRLAGNRKSMHIRAAGRQIAEVHPTPGSTKGDPRLILRRALVRRTRSCRGQFFILHLFDPIGVLFPRR